MRLLDQSEKHWNTADQVTIPVAVHKESFNFSNKTLKAPIEAESRKI
jgi:hypothetical protein